MKKILAIALFTLAGYAASAQQTVKRSNYIATAIMERFEVLKDNKRVRQGNFTATFKGVTVARGTYKNGNRVGNWDFFDTKGKLLQTFNYELNKFVFLDSTDTQGIKCFVENIKPADIVTVPIKIGGSCYGLLPLLYRDELSQMVRTDNPGLPKAKFTHLITIDAQGNIISHKVTALVGNKTSVYSLDDSHLDPDVARFIPATVNHKPVTSQVSTVTFNSFYGAVVKEF